MSKLFECPRGKNTRWASFENPRGEKGAAAQENRGAKGHAFDRIPAGGDITLLDYRGAGMITRIWMTVSDRSPKMLRSLVLRCYWDGCEKPAVEAPLGDFFCCGSALTPFENELFSSPEGKSFNAYIPMPFAKSAYITVTNESETDLSHIFYDVDLEAWDEPDPDALYFHTWWNRENPTKLGEDCTVLPKVEGRGRFLGAAYVMNDDDLYERQWWGEGEFKAWIDGDGDFPTLCGTGTEDYIGTGWGQGVYANRYQGCLTADSEKGRWVFYRLNVPDAIYFHENFRAQLQVIGGCWAQDVRRIRENGAPLIPISMDDSVSPFRKFFDEPEPFVMPESGYVNYLRQGDMAVTAYFYLDQPADALPAIPPQSARIAGLEAD